MGFNSGFKGLKAEIIIIIIIIIILTPWSRVLLEKLTSKL